MNLARLRKYASAALQPSYFPALRRKVMPGIEHRPVIAQVRPGTLLDVGANKGQFSLVVQRLFPKARIIAFEPMPAARAKFAAVVSGAATLLPYAVGEERGPSIFFVADRADSSSLLAPATDERNAYAIAVDRKIQVEVVHIQDHVDLSALPRPVLMKIDVQGFELSVLRSLGDRIAAIDFIYCELSFIELYDGQPLAGEVIDYLRVRGFGLRGVYDVSVTARFGPTQADMLFERL